ncbi:unnamed protein product [Arctogadus glacialis]
MGQMFVFHFSLKLLKKRIPPYDNRKTPLIMSPILPTYHIAGTTAGRRTAGSRLSQTPCPVDDMAPSFAVCSESERGKVTEHNASLFHMVKGTGVWGTLSHVEADVQSATTQRRPHAYHANLRNSSSSVFCIWALWIL